MRHILFALPKGWQVHRDAVKPRQQIRTESPLADHVHQRLLARDHDAHIDRHGPGLAERLHFPLLQDAQEFGLQGQRQVRNLVEQQGSTLGAAKKSRAGTVSASKGAASVAKQLPLGQPFGQGRAVDCNQGSGPTAPRVHATGDDLLAGSGFTLKHDGEIARGGLTQRRNRGLQRGAAEQPRRDLGEFSWRSGDDTNPPTHAQHIAACKPRRRHSPTVHANAVATF